MVWNFEEDLQIKRNQQCWFKKLKSWFQEHLRTGKNAEVAVSDAVDTGMGVCLAVDSDCSSRISFVNKYTA